MQEIKILDPKVVDQIAAGEVVERPAHLVKELVENSLDAGATAVEINFANGGRFVKVVDNGKGIAPTELRLALTRFATSKIASADDLFRLASFGFRGEALASISSVSELTLRSRRPDSSSAYEIRSEFGKLTEELEIGGPSGTMVEIKDLFANLPARLKFLKSAAAESTQIKNAIKAIALSNPKVEFKVFSEGVLTLFWPAHKNFIERAKAVLEIEELFEGKAEREGVRAYSIFASPENIAKTSKNIWIFCQGRWIQDRGLQSAVMESYRNLLMHGEYPHAVSFVELDSEWVDVNIHPTKSQVKFHNPSLAFRAVQASIREVLEKAPWIKQQTQSYLPETNSEKVNFVSGVQKAIENFSESFEFKDENINRTQFAAKSFQPVEFFSEAREIPTFPSLQISKESAGEAISKSGNELLAKSSQSYWSQLEVLAQAHLTYIITQSKQGLVIIDQHAAHERVLFEKIRHAWDGGGLEIQDYLFPLTIDLTPDRVEVLLSQGQELKRFGIEIEQLGPESLGIKSAPLILKESALAKAIEQMANDLLELGGSYRLENKLNDLCATMACHSAVRAGQAMSHSEMQALLVSMDEFPLSSFCPHGRPVSVIYGRSEIEKDFGRLV